MNFGIYTDHVLYKYCPFEQEAWPMKSTLLQIKDDFFYFIKTHKPVVVLSILTLVLCYGFTLTNYSIGTDETAFDVYFDHTELLAQGRFSGPLLQKLLGIYEFAPFWLDAVALICLFIGIILWCLVFSTTCDDCLHQASYVAFATIFISYPLINEIFILMTMSLSICLTYALTALALLIMQKFSEAPRFGPIAVTSIILCFAVSFYESFASVYLCGIFCILILENLFSDLPKNFKRTLKRFVFFLLPILIGVILEFIVSNLLIFLLGLQHSSYSETQIFWFTGSIPQTIRLIIASILEDYFLIGASYLPIFIFAVFTMICIVLGIVLWVKKRSSLLFILFAGLSLSTFSLSLIQGRAAAYRTCQAFAVFIAFLVMLSIQLLSKRKIIHAVALCLVFVLVLEQSKDLSQWFYMDYLRYQEDKSLVLSVGNTLEQNFDLSKPVVFVGDPKISDYILDYRSIKDNSPIKQAAKWGANLLPLAYSRKLMTIIDSRGNQINGHWLCVAWGVNTLGTNTELIKFMALNGFDLKQGSVAQYNDGCQTAKTMAAWPKSGSIKDTGGYILVNFGLDQNSS